MTIHSHGRRSVEADMYPCRRSFVAYSHVPLAFRFEEKTRRTHSQAYPLFRTTWSPFSHRLFTSTYGMPIRRSRREIRLPSYVVRFSHIHASSPAPSSASPASEDDRASPANRRLQTSVLVALPWLIDCCCRPPHPPRKGLSTLRKESHHPATFLLLNPVPASAEPNPAT